MPSTGKFKKILKAIGKILLILLILLILFVGITFIVHKVKSANEWNELDEAGYVHLIQGSGDYKLNVRIYGDENAEHTIIGMAGMGTQDFQVKIKHLAESLADKYRVIIIDRAGYGLSDDTKTEQTMEQVVADYRAAVKNLGINEPCILMGHSLAGNYVSYWESTYPDEIEAAIYLDPQIIGDIDTYNKNMESMEYDKFGDSLQVIGTKIGLGRIYFMFPENQYWSGMTGDNAKFSEYMWQRDGATYAAVSEDYNESRIVNAAYNAIKTNDIPKLYIDAQPYSYEDFKQYKAVYWDGKEALGRKIDISNDDDVQFLYEMEQTSRNINGTDYERGVKPYMDMLGNVTYINIPGDHFIFVYRPEETIAACREFLERLENT